MASSSDNSTTPLSPLHGATPSGVPRRALLGGAGLTPLVALFGGCGGSWGGSDDSARFGMSGSGVCSVYIDARLAGSRDDFALSPLQIGATANNWLGRSQYNGDPHFKGRLADLRIDSGALTAAQVADIAARS